MVNRVLRFLRGQPDERTLVSPVMAAREVLWLVRDRHGIEEAAGYHVSSSAGEPWTITICEQSVGVDSDPELRRRSMEDFSRLVCEPAAALLADRIKAARWDGLW